MVFHYCEKNLKGKNSHPSNFMIRDFLKINCYHLTSIRKDNGFAKDNQVHIASSGVFLIVDAIISFKNLLSTYNLTGLTS